jgi:hypothetical protein
MGDFSSLWQCPICSLDSKKPTQYCPRCGCHLLLLAKIKLESWQAMARAEEAKSKLFFYRPKKTDYIQKLKRLLCFKK